MTIRLGSFFAGEIPEPLTYTFQDADGQPLDLTGYTGRFEATNRTDTVSEVATVDGADVTHVWAELTPGLWKALLWVGNGTNRYASELVVYTVRTPPTPPPEI